MVVDRRPAEITWCEQNTAETDRPLPLYTPHRQFDKSLARQLNPLFRKEVSLTPQEWRDPG
jgi:hypothetical protein